MLPTYEPALCLLAAVRREITVLALGIWSSRGKMPAEMCWVPWAMGHGPMLCLPGSSDLKGWDQLGVGTDFLAALTFGKREIKQLSSQCFRGVKQTRVGLTASIVSLESSDNLWTCPQGKDEPATFFYRPFLVSPTAKLYLRSPTSN